MTRGEPLRVLVAAWVGSDNLGDELLFACLSRRLQELGAQVAVLSKSPVSTERLHGVRAVPHNDMLAIVKELSRSDALVFGGGGLLQDSTSIFSLPSHLARLALARACRVPFIGVGLGVGPLKRPLSSWLIRNAFKGHRGITVRDRASADLLSKAGVSGVRVSADMALSLEPSSEPASNQIVLALRSYREGLLPERFRGADQSDAMEERLAEALDETHRRTGMHLRFLAFEGARDEQFNQRIASKMRTRDVSLATPSLTNILDEMSRARLAIAMRYHGGITAVVAERPAVLIGYAPKVAALAESLGEDCAYVAHDASAFAQLPDIVVRLLECDSMTLRQHRIELQKAELGNRGLLESFLSEVACRS